MVAPIPPRERHDMIAAYHRRLTGPDASLRLACARAWSMWEGSALSLLPDQVAIFRGPILRVTRTRAQAIQQIRETVIHELGHYFGLGDHDMVY